MAEMGDQIRDLNLSYNCLNFDVVGSPEYQHSQNFLDNMFTLFKNAKVLNHLNFSGINMPQEQMVTFCMSMKRAKFLMGVHLSDNGITQNEQYMEEVLQIFDLGLEDIPL